MPKLQPNFNFGTELKNENQDLYNQLTEMYFKIAQILNTKTSKNNQSTDPVADAQVNLNYDIGDVWVNSSSNMSWIMTSRVTNSNVVWTQIT